MRRSLSGQQALTGSHYLAPVSTCVRGTRSLAPALSTGALKWHRPYGVQQGKRETYGCILQASSQSRESSMMGEMWSLQKDLLLKQMDQMDSDRKAWAEREARLLAEIRELHEGYRTAWRDVYQDFFQYERIQWQQERQQLVKHQATLTAELEGLKAQLAAAAQQPLVKAAAGLATAPPPSPPPVGSKTPSEQVAAVVRSFSGASAASSAIPQPQAHTPPALPSPISIPGTVQGADIPSFATEIAAAMAAVEEVDVLQQRELDSFMSRFKSSKVATSSGTTTAAGAPTSSPSPTAPLPAATSTPPKPSSTATAPLHPTTSESPHTFIPDESAMNRGVAMERTPYETILAPPNGPPPILKTGDSDIYWICRLHSALASHGYYPADDEVEDFYYGDSTAEATAAFQASMRLPETGVANDATWKKLLMGTPEEKLIPGRRGADDSSPTWYSMASGDYMDDAAGAELDFDTGMSSGASGSSFEEENPGSGFASSTSSSGGSSAGSGAVNGSSTERTINGSSSSAAEERVVNSNSSSVGPVSGAMESLKKLTSWPIIRDMDGGPEVHALQAVLSERGYGCDDDERQWWMFGSSTKEAVIIFQACAGLPETGVVDGETWERLLGGHAKPADLAEITDGEFDDDVSQVTKRVWLLGEQRWSTV